MVKCLAMIRRDGHVGAIRRLLRSFSVVGILGPRQIGKTTLARQVIQAHAGPAHRLDLEDPADLHRLLEDPRLVLDELRGLVVIDEGNPAGWRPGSAPWRRPVWRKIWECRGSGRRPGAQPS